MNEIDPLVLSEIRNIQMLLGRNILVFQNIEHILKLIHLFKQGDGTIDNLLKRKDNIDQLSLGRLTDESYLRKIDSKLSAKDDKKLYLSYNHLPDDEEFKNAIKFFNNINDDRNFLVHNFTAKWKFDNESHREEAKNWLLNQYESCTQQRKVLVSALELITERILAISEYINSDEGKNFLDELSSLKKNEFINLTLEPITDRY